MNLNIRKNKKTWQYLIGFSVREFQKETGKNLDEKDIEKLLTKEGLEFKKVIVGEAIKETIPKCMGAIYKNPSSMREDAPDAFSCSSLISYLYTMAGVWMPSISVDKYVFGKKIDRDELRFGDLVFSNTGKGKIYTESIEYKSGTKVPEGVDHVGMYLGDENVLHATKIKNGVVVEKIDEFKKSSKIVGFRRVANIEEIRFVVAIPENKDEINSRELLIKNLFENWRDNS